MTPAMLQSFQDLIRTANATAPTKIKQLVVAFQDGSTETVTPPDDAPHPVQIPPSPTTKKFSDVLNAPNTSGVYNLEPGVIYDLGNSPIKPISGSDIYLGMDEKFLGQPRPILKFSPAPSASSGSQPIVQAFTLGGTARLAHLILQFSNSAQLLLATKGSIRVEDILIQSGAGLVTMAGADLLDIANIDGVAAANLIYTGHGANNGLLRMRNCNLAGGMINEHGLRTHLLDELDWDGGTFDGSGSMQGKDVLAIHELHTKGIIQNVTFKGWATIGGLTDLSPGTNNDKALVNNLTLRNVTFVPCVRSSPDKTSPDFGRKNGARIYVLAGVTNFLHDTGSIESRDSACYLWTNAASSATRKAPTGTVKNIQATGPQDNAFVQGNAMAALVYRGMGNWMNGKKV